MSELPILDHIQALAEQEIARITDEAALEAGTITADAEMQAKDMTAKAIRNVESEADRIRERQLNTLRFSHNAERYDLKSRALNDLWHEAEVRIRTLIGSDLYPAILAALYAESTVSAPDGATVHAAPEDTELVERLVRDSGNDFTVVPDERISGGISLHWPDGGTVLINTLARRLARLKAEGGANISQLLFGDSGDRDR